MPESELELKGSESKLFDSDPFNSSLNSNSKKRVIFCTNSSLYSSLILEQLLTARHIDVVGVYLSERIRTKSGNFTGDIFRIINASGLAYACYLALGTVFFDLFRWQARPTIKSIAKAKNIPIFSSKNVNAPESLKWLQGLKPDIVFSGFFNQKLGAEALSIPSLAPVNLHAALLPKYKGVDPVFYYFLNGEQTLGVTLHRMDATYDTGEILSSVNMDVRKDHSVFWHNIELFKLGTDLFIQWAKQPEGVNSNFPDPVISTENDYYDSWPTPKQVKQLTTPLFNWKDFRSQALKK